MQRQLTRGRHQHGAASRQRRPIGGRSLANGRTQQDHMIAVRKAGADFQRSNRCQRISRQVEDVQLRQRRQRRHVGNGVARQAHFAKPGERRQPSEVADPGIGQVQLVQAGSNAGKNVSRSRLPQQGIHAGPQVGVWNGGNGRVIQHPQCAECASRTVLRTGQSIALRDDVLTGPPVLQMVIASRIGDRGRHRRRAEVPRRIELTDVDRRLQLPHGAPPVGWRIARLQVAVFHVQVVAGLQVAQTAVSRVRHRLQHPACAGPTRLDPPDLRHAIAHLQVGVTQRATETR